MKHALKLDKKYWPAMLDGRKTFEVRFNDRDFQAGDTLVMTRFDSKASARPAAPPWDPKPPAPCVETVERYVTYVLHDFDAALKPGYVVLGLT